MLVPALRKVLVLDTLDLRGCGLLVAAIVATFIVAEGASRFLRSPDAT
jgi:hypothetical protein